MKEAFSIEPFIFTETYLEGSYIITPIVRKDERGFFYRNYEQEPFAKAGLNTAWVQMNHSYTSLQGTLRGIHFQHPPYSEVKLVRCIAGAVYDVIVDLRKGSRSFLKWYGIELNAENKKMLYIPKGFAHGFQALQNDTELIYMHSENYQKVAESGILYNEMLLDIVWPLEVSKVSERDILHPVLSKDFNGI